MGTVLKVKHRMKSYSEFFERGIPVASFDWGSGELICSDEKIYHLSCLNPEWVECPVYKERGVKKACLVDFNLKPVEDESSADMTRISPEGTITYMKEGERKLIAHSELPPDKRPEIIMCRNKKFEVSRMEGLMGSKTVELFEGNHRAASISTKLLRTKAVFEEDLDLWDRVFITLLSFEKEK